MTVFLHGLHLSFKSVLEVRCSCCVHVLSSGVRAAVAVEGAYLDVATLSELVLLSRVILCQVLWQVRG